MTNFFKYLASNETSIDVIMHYTEVKNRLKVIEDNLLKLTNNFNESPSHKRHGSMIEHKKAQNNTHSLRNESVTSASITNINKYFSSKDYLIIFFAWLLGILSAIFSKKFF